MKKILFAIVITMILASCAAEPEHTPLNPRQMAEVVFDSHEEIPSLVLLLPEDDHFLEYISNIYNLNPNIIEDGAILFSYGMYADEIAVFRLSENADIDEVESTLTSYKQRRASLFMGYAPDQARVLQNGIVSTRGRHVALLVSSNPRGAESYFLASFGDNPPAVPSNPQLTFFSELIEDAFDESDFIGLTEDVYDHDLILAAWNRGNADGLLHVNRSILEKAAYVIDTIITDDMDNYQRQRVIHDWIIVWARFDTEIHNNSPTASPHPHNNNPYGVLIGQRGMCLGFTLALQLFMDMLNIESIVVEGTNYYGDYHAWNVVRIYDNWYAVDVTWNNPVVGRPTPEGFLKFFNVTSDFLWETGHRWDRDLVPEATAGY